MNSRFSKVANWIFLVTLVASLASAFLAPWLVSSNWGVGAQFAPEIQMMTVKLMRVLLLSTIIFSVSSILTSTLYAHEHFITPALLPSMYSAGIIFGALVFTPTMGIFGIAWGAVLGSALHFLIQIPAMIHYKVRWMPLLVFDSGVRRVAS